MQDFNVNYHASICIGGNIYVDPLSIEGEPHNAKVVFITHSHWDHFSIEDIKKVANENTFFIAPQDCIDQLNSAGFKMENQKNYWVCDGSSFETMYKDSGNIGYQIPNTNIYYLGFPSYNINKLFHPKDKRWIGGIFTVDNVRYVICGDTDFTPELKKIKCDVLFVPIGGKYTMNALEAAECTNLIKPKIVVPVHYLLKSRDGSILGNKQDERIFVDKLNKNIKHKVFF